MESQELTIFDPYRTTPRISLEHLYPEMLEALNFMKEWEKFEPVIAGGSLWSWAAMKPARDIDIFLERSWRSKRKAEGLCSHSVKGPLPDRMFEHSDGYGSAFTTTYKSTYKYLHTLPQTSISVDLILAPWSGLDIIDHFDYHHCSVAFSPYSFATNGAMYYAEGKLSQRFSAGARSKEVIESKLQTTLWGKPEAYDRLELVIRTLSQLYAKL